MGGILRVNYSPHHQLKIGLRHGFFYASKSILTEIRKPYKNWPRALLAEIPRALYRVKFRPVLDPLTQ
jgi:hypothetical protein